MPDESGSPGGVSDREGDLSKAGQTRYGDNSGGVRPVSPASGGTPRQRDAGADDRRREEQTGGKGRDLEVDADEVASRG